VQRGILSPHFVFRGSEVQALQKDFQEVWSDTRRGWVGASLSDNGARTASEDNLPLENGECAFFFSFGTKFDKRVPFIPAAFFAHREVHINDVELRKSGFHLINVQIVRDARSVKGAHP
jgi:hypothetical protein